MASPGWNTTIGGQEEIMSKHTIAELQTRQAYPLSLKISLTKQRIRDWVNHYGLENVCISFSGGKDSTVLLDIARSMYPDIKAVFVDTGLEFPEIVKFVKTHDNVDIVRPKLSFMDVVKKYGYPMVSKEVSECVYGARQFLKGVQNKMFVDQNKALTLTDDCGNASASKQASKQASSLNYRYYFDKIQGIGKYQKQETTPSEEINTRHQNSLELADNLAKTYITRGGYDNKYRRVSGLDEYSRESNQNWGGNTTSLPHCKQYQI